MISPIMSRFRRRTFLLLTGVIVFSTLFLFSRGIGISGVGQLATPFSDSQRPAGENNDNKGNELKVKVPDNDEMQKPLAPMAYGTSSRPAFKDLQQVLGDMPREFLLSNPSESSDPDELHTPKGKRLIFVGDIHGQLSAFEALVEKLKFDKTKGDHMVLTGDMVNKGPDSAGVVQLAMDLDASAVRGNHEDRVVLAYASMKSSAAANSTEKRSAAADDHPQLERRDDGPFTLDNMEQEPFSHGDEEDRVTASSLSSLQHAWLAALPVILRVGRIPGGSADSRPWDSGSVVVAHAGLVPGIPVESQDPWVAMNIRGIVYPGEEVRRKQVKKAMENAAKEAAKAAGDEKKAARVTDEQVEVQVERLRKQRVSESGGVDSDRDVIAPVDKSEGDPWADLWDKANRELAPQDRTVVVYGHDAKAGLRVGGDADADRYAFGLDSGCVYGRKLSALVLEAGMEGGIKHSLVQVDCKKAVTKDSD